MIYYVRHEVPAYCIVPRDAVHIGETFFFNYLYCIRSGFGVKRLRWRIKLKRSGCRLISLPIICWTECSEAEHPPFYYWSGNSVALDMAKLWPPTCVPDFIKAKF